MAIKHLLKLSKLLLPFIILATASLILTLSVADILSATPEFKPQIIVAASNYLETADALNYQGRQQLERGDAQAALDSWKQAELAYQKVNNKEGIIGSQINQAQAMQALGQYRQAEQLLRHINEIIAKKPDFEFKELKVVALRSFGDVLRFTGNLTESEKVLNESLNLAQALLFYQNITAAQLSLGNTALAQAKRAKSVNNEAKEQVEIIKARKFYQAVINSDASPENKLKARLNVLNLVIEKEQWSDAQNLWPQIKENVERLPVSSFAIEARINLASSLLKIRENSSQTLPDWKEIAQILTTAWEQANSSRNHRWKSYVLGSLGSLYEATGQYSEAQKVTQEALSLAQSTQAWDIAYQWQWLLGRLYNIVGDKKSAIAFYETAVNTLQSLRQNLAAIDPEGQFSFRDDVEPVYRQLVDLLLQPESNNTEPSQENLKKAREVIESLQLAEIENFFREACLQAKPEQIDNIVGKYERTTAVIYPIILADRLSTILSLPGKELRYYVADVPQNEVEETLRRLRYQLQQPDPNKELEEVSKNVYHWLIEPLEKDLQTKENSIKTLVFVLDGELRNIPMAALYDGKKYLVEKYAIALTSGLQLLDPKRLPRGQIGALIAGATDAPTFVPEEGFGPLPNVSEELQQISRQIRSNRELLEKNFTKTNFKNQLESTTFSIVHLATHGKFSSDPEQTFILASDGRLNIKDLDNWLRLSEQNGLNTIELLVLSACQTAQGDKRAALGLAGVAARAGARSTVATLWQVDDRSTAKLMIGFYKQLFGSSNKLSKAEALRQVQLSLLKDFRYKNPYYWAPFILLGNWF